MERLRRRTDFRAAASAMRVRGRAFVLQGRRRADQGQVRIGFTVSRQVGNAVERNRVRRRLRDVVRRAGGRLQPGHDYVLVGRRAALELPFGEIMQELDTALCQIHAGEGKRSGAVAQRPIHEARPRGSRRPSRGRRPPESGQTASDE
ncbi:MAG: ribonuclease P protein component [Xanthobacteraceae bacterium]